MIRSRRSSEVGGRPGEGGCVHFFLIRRWRQASRVREETIRHSRSARGSSRASAASSERSGHVGLGEAT
ncbi:hypothetical protein ACFCWB_16625 [Streptomyces bacillaris]|uniref:hypothetical protein n=1 Tax=Streptomyces bacillaris TaxID=68179 RepID=UPI0035D738AB